MEKLSNPASLTEHEEEFCNMAGIAGVIISLVCFCQHMYVVDVPGWQVIPVYGLFVFCMAAFGLLIRKHPAAALFISIGCGLTFIYLGFLIFLFIRYHIFFFSYILVILFLYKLIIVISLYTRGLPAKLRQSRLEKKRESTFWEERI